MPTAVTYSKYENLLSVWNLPHLGVRLAELYPQLLCLFFSFIAGISYDRLARNASFSEALGRLSSSDRQWYAQHVCPIISPTAS